MFTFLGCAALSVKWYLLVVIVLLVFSLWRKARNKENEKKNIPSLSTIPMFTTLVTAILFRPIEQLKSFKPSDFLMIILPGLVHLHRKDKMLQAFWAGHRYICCFDASASEKIFQSTAALDKDWLYKLLEPWLGMGLLTSKGNDRWRMRRKMFTPAFYFRILKDFLVIFNEHIKILVKNLKKLEGEVVDITTILPLCTLDIIGETAMGVRLNAQTGGGVEYVEAVKQLTSTAVETFTTPWYWIKPLYQLSSDGKQAKKNISIVHNFTRSVIRRRKEQILKDKEVKEVFDDFQDFDDLGTKKRRALLDLLLYHHLTDNSLSEEDIREEVDTFTFGGHDTTSMTISWTLYFLGWHKDVQEKAYKEMLQIFGDDRERTVTSEDLKEMKYLECVIKETLRLCPVAPVIIRRTSRDIEVDEYVVPANSSVVIFIYGIHRDPSIYPNPEVFDPDRFLPENCIGRHPFAYVPFSAGSRNCIGQRFAMMEVKSTIAHILRNFTVSSLDHRDKLIITGGIIFRPKEPMRLVFQNR